MGYIENSARSEAAVKSKTVTRVRAARTAREAERELVCVCASHMMLQCYPDNIASFRSHSLAII